ncbi:tRNA1(Val) (adenine(37)-N6)-methyltransferase [Niabella terrae]
MKVTTDSCVFGAWMATRIPDLAKKARMLDIGSGSGLLSLMVAQRHPQLIEGVEIQLADWQQSLENIASSPFAGRIKILNADIRAAVFQHPYEVIFSNPPFYENELKSPASAKNLAHHDLGLKLSELLPLIEKNLSRDGNFYLLLPAKRTADLQELIRNSGLFINEITFLYATEHHPAFRVMIRGSFQDTAVQTEQLYIRQKIEYSAAFIQLLKDYYLNL